MNWKTLQCRCTKLYEWRERVCRRQEAPGMGWPLGRIRELPARRPRCSFSVMTFVVVIAPTLSGCDRLDMYDQPRLESLEATDLFPDRRSARPMIAGTIFRGGLHEDQAYYTGKLSESYVSEIPQPAYQAIYDRQRSRFTVDFADVPASDLRGQLLERGRERFDIFCSVCHGRAGDGDGMVVRRGFRRPPSYHTDRLRNSANGYLYDVIQNGIGAMAGYASQIDAGDRWAIVAYIRALQLSAHARIDDVPEKQRASVSENGRPDEQPPRREEQR